MKKGFTLIELLAVIVILAIIALIATPIIIGIINDARTKSAERSMDGFVESIKLAQTKYQMNHAGNFTTSYSELESLIELDNGDNITNREATLDSKGLVETASATITGFSCTYTKSQGSKCTKGSGSETNPSPNLITFTLAGEEYQAEEGMTFGQWEESKYYPYRDDLRNAEEYGDKFSYEYEEEYEAFIRNSCTDYNNIYDYCDSGDQLDNETYPFEQFLLEKYNVPKFSHWFVGVCYYTVDSNGLHCADDIADKDNVDEDYFYIDKSTIIVNGHHYE